MKNQFASDNSSGVCPEALSYLIKCNEGYANPYGEDQWTKQASDMIRDIFEFNCEVFFVYNGTAANSLALSSLCSSYHSIICHENAHIETDECGAPEFFSNGSKLLLASGDNGKLSASLIEKIITKRTDIHYPKPRVLSLTQSTEVGTVYTVNELNETVSVAKQYGLHVHMDGARFANAVASLNVPPKAISWEAGVDVLCFGGTKNGLPAGEAVVFFNKELAKEFDYRCKQAGQLASKMRYVSAPWLGLLQDNLWLKNAQHANECAAYLEQKLASFPELKIMFPRQANSVFVEMPERILQQIRNDDWRFYTFIGVGGARFMCSWSTKKEDIDKLVNTIQSAAAKLDTV